ncbi:putative acireductone synthase UTR4 KNAG_0G00500 [Huiozyma naganishii CBS 8797]|uniref:Enolase-phosphatase E1 n=1 Tax=Huiozyma naganishii (strain ATCC MYA-139 / BCRC 22969 / CBS 8797 / KCTC 17520 / NBRC 10181 / NCYC 3082 / Yp74L-3) TaxID=1071383 RepID=J7S0Q9_HUIN7|nr:hypothetical protein KNAG_0G00500 [Kazachstania naganishii CBS 8797]CCK71107.1 hypothetical protein KNAG_0G00500 [Kazachstania naganishii CBS 8797]
MTFDALLLDIEGTVCPIAFVKDVLFPYFVAQVPLLVEKASDELLSGFKDEHGAEVHREQLEAHILDLVRQDLKDPALKRLQGHVWRSGYEDGSIKAPVYADAVDLLQRHKGSVYIYSSGSVEAQKLLFAHVKGVPGDLTPFIAGYFDITTSGRKTDSESYRSISQQIGKAAERVLFLSDNILELDAAGEAGMQCGLALREGNAPLAHSNSDEYTEYRTFSEL